jgi:hypothetical protein
MGTFGPITPHRRLLGWGSRWRRDLFAKCNELSRLVGRGENRATLTRVARLLDKG